MNNRKPLVYTDIEKINHGATANEMINLFFAADDITPIDDVVPFGDIAFEFDGSKYVMRVDTGCRTLSITSIAGKPNFRALNDKLTRAQNGASNNLRDNLEWSPEHEAELNEQYGV